MKNFFALALTICLILIPSQVFAHSQLTESTPAADAIMKEEVKQIQMTFNTDISKDSTFKLEDAAGQAIAVENIQVEGAQLKGSTSAPLPNGKFTVKWSIIGADGHLIEGNYGFEVKDEQAATAGDSKTEQPPVATPEQPAAQQDTNPMLLPILAGVLGLIAIALFFFMKRKKAN